MRCSGGEGRGDALVVALHQDEVQDLIGSELVNVILRTDSFGVAGGLRVGGWGLGPELGIGGWVLGGVVIAGLGLGSCGLKPGSGLWVPHIQLLQLGLALVVLVQISALERYPRVRLVHRHGRRVLDVLHDEILPHGLELVAKPNIALLAVALVIPPLFQPVQRHL